MEDQGIVFRFFFSSNCPDQLCDWLSLLFNMYQWFVPLA